MPTQFSAREFVTKWRGVELKERSAAQEHFIDLCRLVGHPTPAEADPNGQTLSPLRPARASSAAARAGPTSGSGATSPGSTRASTRTWTRPTSSCSSTASRCRTRRCWSSRTWTQIVVHTNFTNTVKQVVRIDAGRPAARRRRWRSLRAVFYDPDAFRAPQTTEQVTQEAAAEFARLADLLRQLRRRPASRPPTS